MSELAGIKNQIVLAFNGTLRDTLWGIELPPFDYDAFLANGISFDAIAGPTSIVPFRYAAGVNYFIEGKGEPDTKCMSYVFCLGGTLERQEEQMKLIGDFTKALTYDWEKFHVAYRALTNEETRACRTFIYRVYENNGECMEHPEMLCGLPCGMYHCPYCGEMIVAGIPHPTKAMYEEMHAEMQKESEANSECHVPPYTDEQVAVLNEIEEQEAEERGKAAAVYEQAEKSLNTYAELKSNWGGDGEEQPVAASVKNAGEFLATIKELRWPAPEVTLDHEGLVAFLWPDNNDPKDTYISMAFYADETVTYWMERDTEANDGGTIPRDENHEENLMTFLLMHLPQLVQHRGPTDK